jgi:dienelactone hydrolase
MDVRPVGVLIVRTSVFLLLSCRVAAVAWGAPPQEPVVRQQPEEKRFSTGPKPQFTAFLYSPKKPGTARSAGPPVIFYSGEFGWRPLMQDAASSLASTGRFVLGIDSSEYFASLVPAEALARDFEKFRAFVNERAGRAKDADVILVGFGFGAKVIPYLVNETRAPGLRGAVLVAPDTKGFKVFHVTVLLKMESPADERFDVEQELKRMPAIPVVLMEGTLDKDSAAKTLADAPRGPHKYVRVEGGDHQFHDVRDGFFTVLSDALQWIDGTPVPAAPAAPALQATPHPVP